MRTHPLRKLGSWFAFCLLAWLLPGPVLGAVPDPLTESERAWLKQNEPIRFVSQTAYPPFEFIDSDGQRQGMCLDLVRWISRELGFKVVFLDMSFQQAQEAVLEGKADVLTSLFYSEERDQRFDFTPMTWEVPSLIFVRSERPDLMGIRDLRGKRIAMQRGDYAAEFLQSKTIPHEVVPTGSFGDAADQVIASNADAMIGDRPIVLYHLFSHGIVDQMKSVGEPLYTGINGMAVKEGRSELLGILNKGMSRAREQGVFEDISSRWLGTQYGETSLWRPGQAIALSVGFFAAMAIAILLLGWTIHLRRTLAQRTTELREAQDARKPIVASHPWQVLLARSLLFMGLLIPLGIVANYIVERFAILPNFLALEEQEAMKKLNGAVDVIQRETDHLGKTVKDWGFWDDLYAFAESPNADFVESNLQWPALSEQTQIDLIGVYDTEGHRLWMGAYDPHLEQPVSLKAFSQDSLPPESVFLLHPEVRQSRAGLLLTELGPMLVASCAILPSYEDKPSRGTLVMGRFLRKSILSDLSDQLGVDVAMVDRRNSPLTGKQVRLFAQMSGGETRLEETSPDTLAAHAMLADFQGQPAMILSLDIPRDLFRQGRQTSRLFSFILFEFILLILGGTAFWFIYSFRETFRRQAHVEALVEARTTALGESEKKWRSYVESAPMGIFIVNPEGRYLDVNPAACRITGFTADELKQKSISDLLAPECRVAGLEHFKQVVKTGSAVGEYRFIHASGENRWWSVSAVRLDGTHFLGFSEDITHRRQADEARESLQNQLNQAQKMESIGRLAGGVAHDFNNMLGVILGYTELGLDLISPEHPVHDGLLEIRKAATRSTDLTRQLLAFARKQTVVPKVLNLNETVQGMLNMLRRLIGEQIQLDWRPGPAGSSILMDPSQLDQILVNLCVNARDAIGNVGQITIETGLTVFGEEASARSAGAVLGDYATLSVRDNGCGMDDETQAHIFEPFFSTKKPGEGTGLGLATVYGIVRQNHGSIRVSSQKGKGSTFTLFIPRHAPEAPSEPRTAVGADREATSVTILLVEDELAHLTMTRSMLERQGYTVLSASSPGEAIRLVREYRGTIDLLLTDVIMPEMNGHDLALTLVSLRPGIRQLFMSGYTADVIAHHGVLDDGVCFIQKPFTMKELSNKVLGALAQPDAG